MAMVWEGTTGVSVESQIAQTGIHWVCAQPTEMFQCCCWRWWPSWQDGALRQHYLEALHCSWHVYFTGGGIRLSSCCSAPHLQSWCSHSSEAQVPVCWGDSLPMSSEVGSLQCPTPSWVTLTSRNVKWDKMMTAGLYFGNGKERIGSIYSLEWWSLKCNQ